MSTEDFIHYELTPKKLDAIRGKGQGCHDYSQALCGNGSFHFKRTMNKQLVTCPQCQKMLML